MDRCILSLSVNNLNISVVNMHRYKEISKNSSGKYKEKNSKFISFAIKTESIKEVKNNLLIIKKKYKADHYCYAYVLGRDKSIMFSNDDGEPKSSAGKPILGQIISADLTNILIVVLRYYGGIKLGFSGLQKAYKLATKNVLSNLEIVNKKNKENIKVKFNYSEINSVMKIIKDYNLDIISKTIENECKIIFACNTEDFESVIRKISQNNKVLIEKK